MTPLFSANESDRLFAMCCKSFERMVQIFEYVDLRQKRVEHSTNFMVFCMVLEISPLMPGNVSHWINILTLNNYPCEGLEVLTVIQLFLT